MENVILRSHKAYPGLYMQFVNFILYIAKDFGKNTKMSLARPNPTFLHRPDFETTRAGGSFTIIAIAAGWDQMTLKKYRKENEIGERETKW